jgi:nitrate/nitrite transporter NarK
LPSLIVQREFPAASYGVVLGLSMAVAQVAYSTMPAALGVVHDLTGGYAAVLGVCVALHLAASVLMWSGEVSAPTLQPEPIASRLDPIRVSNVHAARGTKRAD